MDVNVKNNKRRVTLSDEQVKDYIYKSQQGDK